MGELIDQLCRDCTGTLEAQVQQLGLELRHWQILVELARLNGCKLVELAARLGTPSSSIADVLADLERHGWIVRREEPHDRRIRRIFLRPAALAMVKRLEHPLQQLSARMFRDISDSERDLFIEALKRVRARFEGELRPANKCFREFNDLGVDPWLENSDLVDQRLSTLTLGVADVTRSRSFYEHALGWRAAPASGEALVFFDLGPIKLALFDQTLLALDSGMGLAPYHGGFRGVTLTHVVGSPKEVDTTLARIVAAGGRLLRPATDAFWGGYSGYFADPDGYAWELAASSRKFPLMPNGEISLPATEAISSDTFDFSRVDMSNRT